MIDEDKNSKQGAMRIRQRNFENVIMIGVESEERLHQDILNVQTNAVANVTVKEKVDVWHQWLGYLIDRTEKNYYFTFEVLVLKRYLNEGTAVSAIMVSRYDVFKKLLLLKTGQFYKYWNVFIWMLLALCSTAL